MLAGECFARSSDAVETTSLSFSCQFAAFGAYVADEGEKVKVVLAPGDKMLGCSPLFATGEDDQARSSFEGAAVIVRRGECSFQDKLAHVAATGAASMVLVNSEDALIPLSSLEYEHSTASAVSVTQSDGEGLIQLVKETRTIELKITGPMGVVCQARTRLQFLVGINAPVAVYEEYVDVVEQLEPLVGTLDELLEKISSDDYESLDMPQGKEEAKELVDFFSWSAQQLSKWSFASQAALHATVAAAVFQIQLGTDEAQAPNDKTQLLLQAAAQKLTEIGYYSHSSALLQTLLVSSDIQGDKSVRCQLSFLKFLQGDVITSLKLSEATGCKTPELESSIPSLQVAHETFDRLTKLKTSAHDDECLERAAGSINDTNLALTGCYLVENASKVHEHARKFSSEFTKELFHTLVLMGVFLDELGAFGESLGFFSYTALLCKGDKTTLKVRTTAVLFHNYEVISRLTAM